MANVSKPQCTMKRILILLLALIPMVAGAQEYEKYISSDFVNADGARTVTTHPHLFVANGRSYGIAFMYVKIGGTELYSLTLAVVHNTPTYPVPPLTIGGFHMIDGTNLYLKTQGYPQVSEVSNGSYMAAINYVIPNTRLKEMLGALKRISVITTDDAFSIPIDYDTASHLMQAYLHLLMKTGK